MRTSAVGLVVEHQRIKFDYQLLGAVDAFRKNASLEFELRVDVFFFSRCDVVHHVVGGYEVVRAVFSIDPVDHSTQQRHERVEETIVAPEARRFLFARPEHERLEVVRARVGVALSAHLVDSRLRQMKKSIHPALFLRPAVDERIFRLGK